MISNLRKRYGYLDIPDITNQLFLIFLSLLVLIFDKNIPQAFIIVLSNFVLIGLINYVVKKYEEKSDEDKLKYSFFKILRYFYPVFMILFCFKEVYVLMFSIWGRTIFDSYLISIDRWIFGFDPTVYLAQFNHPAMVEFFQIIYWLFYFMQLSFVIILYIAQRFAEYKYAMFVVFFGFYLSFIGYLLVPAIGPRFTLHDFKKLDAELEGMFMSEKLRLFINSGESIPVDVPDPENYAQRDAFPSGHTLIALLITYLAFRFRSKWRWWYCIYTILMIFSTVYLRYHYVIDLIAAIPFAVVTILVAENIYKGRINFKTGEAINSA
ncbi:MAG TPA: phosphatase PAP2 family protein [Ignavibacteria bacterium]|nr:phosphatase PAP2 family protein [Ignavibacteria bacterium]